MRDGSEIYSKPAGTTAVPNTPIESAKFNSVIDDIAADLNYPRPITAGGTGSTSASAARSALGLDAAQVYAVKTGDYTALAADNNAFHNFTGATPTLSLTAAATLGANWHYDGYASGGPVIIDPSGAELINGAATITVPINCKFSIKCNGTAFVCVILLLQAALDARYARPDQPIVWAQRQIFKSFGGMGTASPADSFQIDANNPVDGAFIKLHRPGAFGSLLGMDGDNQLKFGAWSFGAGNLWPVHHDGIAGRCRAYINFNGTGTIAIRKSFNVASIVDSGIGYYGVNFATPMPDANYIIVGTCGTNSTGVAPGTMQFPSTFKTTNGFALYTSDNNTDTLQDFADINIAVYG
jgi:hypothetical protein